MFLKNVPVFKSNCSVTLKIVEKSVLNGMFHVEQVEIAINDSHRCWGDTRDPGGLSQSDGLNPLQLFHDLV